VSTPSATSGPSAPDLGVVNPVQSSAPEKRPTGLIVLMIILSLVLIGIIGWLFLVNGGVPLPRSSALVGASREPRRLYELFRAHRRVASQVAESRCAAF
jgi:hypothetical protein